jgi:hypothetical protein
MGIVRSRTKATELLLLLLLLFLKASLGTAPHVKQQFTGHPNVSCRELPSVARELTFLAGVLISVMFRSNWGRSKLVVRCEVGPTLS